MSNTPLNRRSGAQKIRLTSEYIICSIIVVLWELRLINYIAI